jgi:hypothetical protein
MYITAQLWDIADFVSSSNRKVTQFNCEETHAVHSFHIAFKQTEDSDSTCHHEVCIYIPTTKHWYSPCSDFEQCHPAIDGV